MWETLMVIESGVCFGSTAFQYAIVKKEGSDKFQVRNQKFSNYSEKVATRYIIYCW